MTALATLIIGQLPNLVKIVNNLTGNHLPPTIVEDGKKLYDFVINTVENIKQTEPLTPEQDAELDALIEELPKRDYWKSKDA